MRNDDSIIYYVFGEYNILCIEHIFLKDNEKDCEIFISEVESLIKALEYNREEWKKMLEKRED